MPRRQVRVDHATFICSRLLPPSFLSIGTGKRAPSAYNKFMAEHMKQWRAENPGRPVKEAMSAVSQIRFSYLSMSMFTNTRDWHPKVAAEWRNAPENPNRGQDPKKKTKKVPAEKAPSRSSKKKVAASSDTEAAD